jgi:hypothetical protein
VGPWFLFKKMTQLNVLKKYMIINIYIYMVLLFHHLDPTVQPNPMRPTDRPVHVPAPPMPPVRPRATHPTPLRLTNPATPDPTHPNPASPDLARPDIAPLPPPLVSTASCYASRCPTTDERPCLPLSSSLPPAPLPPPTPSASPTDALASAVPVPHKMTEKIIK